MLIWRTAGGTGAGGFYNIVGFGAIVLTGDDEHAQWFEGATVSDSCLEGTQVEGHDYRTVPGGDFIIDVTGSVQLMR